MARPSGNHDFDRRTRDRTLRVFQVFPPAVRRFFGFSYSDIYVLFRARGAWTYSVRQRRVR